MSFTENFAEFLNVSEFASAGTWSVGPTPINLIFDSGYEATQLGLIAGIEGARLTAMVETASVPTIAHGQTIAIGGLIFTIRGIQPDGTGMTLLVLEESDEVITVPTYSTYLANAEGYGALPTATSSVNTAAIRAALATGQTATLTTPGVYSVDEDFGPSPLVIGRGVRFLVNSSQAEVRPFDEWAPASGTWAYNSPAFRDTTITWNGFATANLTYSATPNTNRVDWQPLTSGPTQTEFMGLWVRNATAKYLAVEVLIDKSGGFSAYTQLLLMVPPTGGGWKQLFFSNGQDWSINGAYSSGGDWTAGDVFAQMQILRIRQSTLALGSNWGSGDTINIGPLITKPRRVRPMFMITHDDGFASVYENRAWLTDRKLRSTCFVYPQYLGRTSGYMNAGQLQELYGLGWDVGNHGNDEFFFSPSSNSGSGTVSHDTANTLTVVITSGGTPHQGFAENYVNISGLSSGYNGIWKCASVSGTTMTFTVPYSGSAPTGTAFISGSGSGLGLNTMTAPQGTASVQYATDWLLSQGFYRSAYHHALPQGTYSAKVKSMMASVGIKSVRATLPGNIAVGNEGLVQWAVSQDPNKMDGIAAAYMASSGTYADVYVQRGDPLVYGGVLSVEAGGNLANVQRVIDANITRGGCLPLLTHSLGPGDIAWHHSWMDYLVTKRDLGLCDIVTVSEMYAALTR